MCYVRALQWCLELPIIKIGCCMKVGRWKINYKKWRSREGDDGSNNIHGSSQSIIYEWN